MRVTHQLVSRLWLPAMVLVAGLGLSGLLLWTAPQTQPEDKTNPARLVQVLAVSPTNFAVTVTAHGPVIPARKVIMRPQVRGRVVGHHPALAPGGYIREGEELVRIDAADYEQALTQAETSLEEAQFELEVERGRQVVAAREWRLLEKDLAASEANRSLVLREPHLRRTEARMRQATNEIARARLELARTSVTAPFNAMVLEESIEVGQLVEPGTSICTLVGTDEFWVQAALSLGDLRWVQLPTATEPGATARVLLDTGAGEAIAWEGRVVRLLSDLEPIGRMARVVVRVPDPMRLLSNHREPPLLLGSYVRVDLAAGRLEAVLAIPRTALREGNRIWVVDAAHRLQIHPIHIRWTQGETVLIDNCLGPDDVLVLSGLRTALPGLRVDPQPLPPGAGTAVSASETGS
ncbi:MAG: efflux RND transporter periplasmic adaptor subunit [Verrucomicrobia bacterium]|nr:efflux RND transporter periplasmic adaptor subunit [Verrucomicrobiota bacterium]